MGGAGGVSKGFEQKRKQTKFPEYPSPLIARYTGTGVLPLRQNYDYVGLQNL